MNISVNDIESNISLDKNAMALLLGGAMGSSWSNVASSISVSPTRCGSWIFVKKTAQGYLGYRNCYRTITKKVRQCKRQWQFRRFSPAI